MFLKNFQNSQQIYRLTACTFVKKRLRPTCFPVNFTKFLRTHFLQKTCKQRLFMVAEMVENSVSFTLYVQSSFLYSVSHLSLILFIFSQLIYIQTHLIYIQSNSVDFIFIQPSDIYSVSFYIYSVSSYIYSINLYIFCQLIYTQSHFIYIQSHLIWYLIGVTKLSYAL